MEYQIGDIIKLKKPHPCGSQEWEILRVGADFRLKCMGVWTSGYGVPEAGGKEYQRNPQSLKFVIIQSYIRICKYIRKICIFCLIFSRKYGKVFYCDIL